MEKRVDWVNELPDGSPSQYMLFDGLVKTASAGVLSSNTKILPEIEDYIENLQPDADKAYILAIALGCGEFWGANLNADWFGADQLNPSEPGATYGYKSFLSAKIYRSHNAGPGKPVFGGICMAAYNERMGRVEVIYYLDTTIEENKTTLCNMENGVFPSMSMGCKIAYDVCSICGNKASTGKDYCEHIKRMKNKILHDGRKVMMINIKPRFYDLSIVDIPADRTAISIRKVASDFTYNIKRSATKNSEIDKDVPVERIVTPDVKNWMPEALGFAREVNTKVPLPIIAIIRNVGPMGALRTLASTGLKPSPEEFCTIMNKFMEQEGMLEHDPVTSFTPYIPEVIPGDVFAAFRDLLRKILRSEVALDPITPAIMEARSVARPMVIHRAITRQVNLAGNSSDGLKGTVKTIIDDNGKKTITQKEISGSNTPTQNIMNLLYFLFANSMPDIGIKTASVSDAVLRQLLHILMLWKLNKALLGLVSNNNMVVSQNPEEAKLKLYMDAVQGIPAAVSVGLFDQMTDKKASLLSKGTAYAKLFGPPLAAYAMSSYFKNKTNKGYSLTPTQQFLMDRPLLTTALFYAGPRLLSKLNIPQSGVVAGAGLLGYGIGQTMAKTSSVDPYGYSALIGPHKDASLATMIPPELFTDDVIISSIAALLGGAGLGLMVGVNPSQGINYRNGADVTMEYRYPKFNKGFGMGVHFPQNFI